MERLQQSQMFKTYPDDEDLLEDVLTETQQAIEMTNIESNILSSMMDAFASIISNNLNGVMKFWLRSPSSSACRQWSPASSG